MSENLCNSRDTLSGEFCTQRIDPYNGICRAGHIPASRIYDISSVSPESVRYLQSGTVDFEEINDFSFTTERISLSDRWPVEVSENAKTPYYNPSSDFYLAAERTREAYREMDFHALEKEHFRVARQWKGLWARKKDSHTKSNNERILLSAEELELSQRRGWLSDALTRTPAELLLEEQSRLREANNKKIWINKCTELDKMSNNSLEELISTKAASLEADEINDRYRDEPPSGVEFSYREIRRTELSELKNYQKQRAAEKSLSINNLREQKIQAEALAEFIKAVANKTVVPNKAKPVSMGKNDYMGTNLDLGRDEYRRAMQYRVMADRATIGAATSEANRIGQLLSSLVS